MNTQQVFDTIRKTTAMLFDGPTTPPQTHGVVRPCPCGDPKCQAAEQVQYLGRGGWIMPDNWSGVPTAPSHGQHWKIYDAQGREHLLWVRES